MAEFRLPRLVRAAAIATREGLPSLDFTRWWQSVVVKLEGVITDLQQAIADILLAQAAADAAQVDADAAVAATIALDLRVDAAEAITQDATVVALAAYNTNGLLTQTAADTFTGRTLTGPAAGITVSNGNGVAGNPTLALANDLAALEALNGTNTVYYRSAADTWSAVTFGAGASFTGGTLSVIATGSAFGLIERYSANGTVGTYTFSSIPSGYSSIIIRAMGQTSAAVTEANLQVQFNGDTGANYDYQFITGAGTAASAAASASNTWAFIGGFPGTSAPAGTAGSCEVVIPRYSDTTFHKLYNGTGTSKGGTIGSTFRARALTGYWRNTAAISSATVFLSSGNFPTGTVIEIWGVP